MSKLIRIQSTKTITVTGGLNFKDVTNPDAHVPDRLKVSAEWPRCTVQIKQGVGTYPADIKDWPTVQALAKDEVLTLGETFEPTTDEDIKKVQEFEIKQAEITKNETKKRTRKNLKELTEE